MKTLFKRFLEMLRRFGVMRRVYDPVEQQKIPTQESVGAQKSQVAHSQVMTSSRASGSNNDLATTPLIYAAPSIADIKRDTFSSSHVHNNCYDSSSDYSSSSFSLSDD